MKTYHKNPRQITARQLSDLEKWLRELGDLSGIVHDLNSDEVIGGNQRSRVFDINRCEIELTDGPHEPDEQGTVALGWVIWEGKRYAYRQVRWTPEQCEQANVIANKAGGNWDWDILAKEFSTSDLMEWGFDADALKDLKMDAAALDNLLKSKKEPPPDDPGAQVDKAEELREKWGTALGQLWQIGEHRLICGDCTDPATIRRLLGEDQIDIICTDPPYCSGGFQEAGKASGSVGTDAQHKAIVNDTLSTRGYAALLKSSFSLFDALYLYVFTDWRMWVYLFDIAESASFSVRSMIVWDKGSPGMGRGWRAQHELVLFGCKQTPPFDKHSRGVGNVIRVDRTGNINHTTEKPVELIEKLLANVPFAQIVADPFCGSGTTLVACERLHRRGRGVEISPAYVAVTLERLSQMGLEPVLLD
jgi:DNA modification methylase